MRQGAAQNFFCRGALSAGVKLDDQAVILRRNAFKADAVSVEMMPDGKPVRHADTLADGTNSQGRLLLLHGEPEPEQAAQE